MVVMVIGAALEVQCGLTFLTFNFRVSRVSSRTVTKWFVVDDLANCIDTTIAGIHAKGVVAWLQNWKNVFYFTFLMHRSHAPVKTNII